MKKYNVELKDKDGEVVLNLKVFAVDDLDAEVKCNALVSTARDKRVVAASFSLPN